MSQAVTALLIIAVIVIGGYFLVQAPKPSQLPEQQPTASIAGANTINIIDQRGKQITLPDFPQRIVTIPIPAASMIYALDGSGKKLMGMNPESKKAIEKGILGVMDPSLSQVSSAFIEGEFIPNVEEIIKLQPDVVFQWANKGADIIEPLERAGLNVIGLNYGSQEDLLAWITIMGQVLNAEERAIQLIAYQEQWFEYLQTINQSLVAADKIKTLYLSDEKLKTRGRDTYQHQTMVWTGAENVTANLTGSPTISMEQIIGLDPEIIYVGNFGSLTTDVILDNTLAGQSWVGISAVENKQVYQVPLGGYRWDPPSQESPLMWLWLLQAQYPEHVRDINLREEIKSFYRSYYNFELTAEQLDWILRCDTNNSRLPSCQVK